MELLLKELISSRSSLEDNISSTEKDLLLKEETLRTKDSSLQNIRVKEASLRERSHGLKRELEATRSLIADRQRRIGEVERILSRASSEQAQFSGGESQLEDRIEELTLLLGNTWEQLSTVKDTIEQSNAKVNRMLEKTKELHKSGDRKTAEATQLALEIEKLSGDLTHLIQNLEEKYGPGCLDTPVASSIQAIEPGQPDQDEANQAETSPATQATVTTVEMTAEEESALSEEVEDSGRGSVVWAKST